MHETKLVLKWDKTDEISVNPTERIFSENTSNFSNFSFSRNILTSRKETDPFNSVSIENFMFLCFLLMYSAKNCACSGLLNKTKTKISFV